MRTVNATFQSEKNKSTNKPIHLYTLWDYDGASNNLYLAEYDTDVVYSGVTYTRFPIKFDRVGENSSGQIDSVNITLANVSRLIQGYLENYDLRGKKVTIRDVWANQLADTSAYSDTVYFIDSISADQDNVVFSCTSKFDVLAVQLPLRKYNRNHCSWKFKGTECGYSGATTSCNKTKAACKAMAGGSNYQRFGAFPSIQPNNVAYS